MHFTIIIFFLQCNKLFWILFWSPPSSFPQTYGQDFFSLQEKNHFSTSKLHTQFNPCLLCSFPLWTSTFLPSPPLRSFFFLPLSSFISLRSSFFPTLCFSSSSSLVFVLAIFKWTFYSGFICLHESKREKVPQGTLNKWKNSAWNRSNSRGADHTERIYSGTRFLKRFFSLVRTNVGHQMSLQAD